MSAFDSVAKKTAEVFGSLSLMSDHYGSSEPFQQHFKSTMALVREHATACKARGQHADARYFEGFAHALEQWNYG